MPLLRSCAWAARPAAKLNHIVLSKENQMNMKASRAHSLLIFALVVMFVFPTVAAGCQMIPTQEGPAISSPVSEPGNSPDAHHILLDAEDFSETGDAITVIGPDRVAGQRDSIPTPGVLSGWSELVATTLLVQSRESELDNAIVSMSSYKFASEKAGRHQLENINVALEREGIQVLHDASLLDDASKDLLTERSTSWHLRAGKDDENLLAYVLWIQLDTYVIETYIAVEERSEQYGQQILHHLVQQVFTKEATDASNTLVGSTPRVLFGNTSW